MSKQASRNTGRSGGSSVFTGVLIGLIVGAILAVGVALWVTGNNPFNSIVTPAAPPVQTPPAAPDAAPSFDFYKVLPSDTSAEMPAAATPAAPVTRYYLQAGAFQHPADADNLKAQLALLGVETVIQTSEVAGIGVVHRVRVGPLLAMSDVDRARSLLAQNKIPVTLVKEVPAP